jgi:hypothetical protein
MTTRRDVLRGAAMIAAAPTALATPAIAAGDTSPVRAALTPFRPCRARRGDRTVQCGREIWFRRDP